MTQRMKDAQAMGDITRELAALSSMTVAELAARYEEVYGEPCRSRNKDWLRKQIAWRIQELAEGGLSPRALAKIDELNADAITWPRPAATRKMLEAVSPDERDPRLPPSGTILTRTYKGVAYQVTVLQTGFSYEGLHYPSLSKIAREITGTNWNGFLFFKLQKRARKSQEGTS